ncbi:MAG: oxygenase MpaB family protein [Microthrixaceae bacterium]
MAGTALPHGIPPLRNELVRRTGFFATSLDPLATPGDPGLFGPGSATWALVGQPSQALAGLRAALLQTLSVPIPTATHSTGKFYDDFLGRVSRTGAFVQAQNLGSLDEVHRSARRVRAMHRGVAGVGRDGTRFDATDPHQTAWVSMTLTDSFLVMTERFGRGRIARSRADAFVREQSRHAALLDPRAIWTLSSATPSSSPSCRRARCRCPSSRKVSCPPPAQSWPSGWTPGTRSSRCRH